MAEIVVVGGCIVDLISYVSRFPTPGETIAGSNFSKGCGGKAANQAVMAKLLHGSVGLISKLGDDSFGREYLQNLKELEVNSEFVSFSKHSQTSTASILVTDEGQNSIAYVPGACLDLTPDDILASEQMIKNSKVLLCTYEAPCDTLLTALKLAKKYNVTTVVNAAPATDLSFEKLYPWIDIICLNEVEAEETTGLHLKEISDSANIIADLHKKGCCKVILTLGSKGAVFQDKCDSSYTYVPSTKVKAIDTTGAGDAFMGSLVFFLAYNQGKQLEDIIKMSCEIATRSVLKKGTQTSFPKREELPRTFFDQYC